MQRPENREFREWARFQEDEAIWPAQVITWLPLVSYVVSFVVLLVTLVGLGIGLRQPAASLASVAVSLLYVCLYGLAGSWIGARQRRGVRLAIAIFTWSLIGLVLSGRLVSLGAAYDVVALILVIRAGRAMGMRYVSSRYAS